MNNLAALAVKAPNVMEQFTAGQNQANRNQAFKIEEHRSMVEDMENGVIAANTPEKWARYVQQVTPLYGENVVAPYRNFESRNQLLGQLQSTLGERKFAEGKRVGDRNFDALQSHRASTLAAASDKAATDREYRTERDAVKDDQFDRTLDLNQEKVKTKAKTTGFDQYGLKIGGASSSRMRILVSSGVDVEKAKAIVAGRIKTGTNPVTGEISMIDMATGEMTPLTGQNFESEQPPAALENQDGLFDQANDATGVASGIRDIASNTIGQIPGIGDAFFAEDTVKAKNDFDLYKRDLIRSLSLNPRFPVAEQKRIEGLVPTGAFVSPRTLKTSLRNLDAELARIEQEMLRGVADTNRSVKDRSTDGHTLQSVRAARQRLNVPDDDKLQTTKSKYGLE